MRLCAIILVVLTALTSCTGGAGGAAVDGPLVVASSFPSYDAARAVMGGRGQLSMLLPPGSDVHSWEPTIEDVVRINDADLFIYTGGESDAWLDGILSQLDSSVTVFSLVDNASTVFYESEEGIVQGEDDGHDHEDHGHGSEIDEHVWTSLENEMAIVQAIADTLSTIDPDGSDAYQANASAYTTRIDEIKQDFQAVVDNAVRKEIVVTDRFPLLYFANEFGLEWMAAYPGCVAESEPSAKTVAALIDHVRDEGIPVVLHMELSNTMLSEAVAEETGANVLEFSSCHNVSKRQFDEGLTYADLMEANVEVLKEALS